MPSNKDIPDFTEDLVSCMVQMLLTIVRFPRAPFALVPLSKKQERYLGADVKIESITPLYLQFKRPFAYRDTSTAKFLKERKKLGLSNSPRVLYFELRNKQKGQTRYQHNILYKLRERLTRRGLGEALYVAPLFLSRTAYASSIHLSAILSWRPWYWFDIDHFSRSDINIFGPSGSIRFQNIPILKEHITIPPHTLVSNHKHRYSYLERGNEACFHSPEAIENNNNLGEVIYNLLRFQNGEPTMEMIDYEGSLDFLHELKESISIESAITENQVNGIFDQWANFGEILKQKYEIEQFMFVRYHHT